MSGHALRTLLSAGTALLVGIVAGLIDARMETGLAAFLLYFLAMMAAFSLFPSRDRSRSGRDQTAFFR